MKSFVPLTAAVALFTMTLVASETLRSDNIHEIIRQRRSANPSAASPQDQTPQINYRPYSQVPDNIKQLLSFQQAREPITHIPSQPVPQLSKTPTPTGAQYKSQVQYTGQSQPQTAYQPQQHQGTQQIQAGYNPGVNPHAQFNPQQFQQLRQPQGQQQQQIPGNIFHPEQRHFG